MKSRLLVTILAAMLIGLALLSLRQQRIETVHKMTDLHRSIDHHRSTLWSLRATIATQTRPAAIRTTDLIGWKPAVMNAVLESSVDADTP
ncbi:MAG TPA: hypothetical protein QF800_05640 [Phycisphaerales bacterium]|mgnify:CR=1 FL=1|jgi:hypothetical protein|nr:hypothetical protein [Phycisphaerales bacterium]